VTAILFRPSGRSQDQNQTIKMLKKEKKIKPSRGLTFKMQDFFISLQKPRKDNKD